ncbi:MAG: GTPase ObgE [Elusimicrobia bacterium]|nr:GTPase ObgE [Elusimicrobiota bacterium]
MPNNPRKSHLEFIDTVKIYLKAGTGGNGCMSFRREKFIPYGGPNGGNGGKGGDIYIQTSPNVNTLLELSRRPHITANDGEHGKGKNLYGRKGPDIYISVPIGTLIKDGETILQDLNKVGDIFLVARGGRGGRGNTSFKTQENTAPKYAENGEPGEEKTIHLELKLLADVGLAGFPNAGKSTFLAAISDAKPRIADYPFTTLKPNLGMILHKQKDFVAADIPGLIEGAHSGKGLGDVFLRHIQRTKLILHFIDPNGFKNVSPVDSIKLINAELKKFSPKLARKKQILVVNKADLPNAEEVFKKVKKRYKSREIFLVSSITSQGITKLIDKIIATLPEIDPTTFSPPPPKAIPPLDRFMEKGFKISRDSEGVLEVESKNLLKLISMTNFAQDQAVEKLKNTFKLIGLDKAIKKEGVKDGEVIRISGKDFEWFPDAPAINIKKSKFQYKYTLQLKKRRKTKIKNKLKKK